METVIQLADVSKAFRVDTGRTPLVGLLSGAFGNSQEKRFRYSLHNLNLTITKGERVGLVGNNGAGKTTLLKLIAGLYAPTSGRIMVKGRITFLAGFGIGMVDEMTVAENAFLYAAIYGVDRDEIEANLEEIVSWAGLTEFVQTRFKHLSDGMKIRLAFSTTRYFDADIYLLDEALSAGDQSFRKKCEQVFLDYKKSARTMLIASHNMTFVEDFCDKTIWIEGGKLIAFGETKEVIANYLAVSGLKKKMNQETQCVVREQ